MSRIKGSLSQTMMMPVSSSSEEEEPPLPQIGDVEASPLLRRSGRERRTPARFLPR